MRTPAPISYLRLFSGLLFVALGVFSIIGIEKSSLVVGQDIPGVEIVFGIIELIGGLALIVGVFTSFRIPYIHVIGIVLFYVWLIKILLNILSLAVPGFPSTSGVTLDLVGWIGSFIFQVLIASSLYVLYKDYNLL